MRGTPLAHHVAGAAASLLLAALRLLPFACVCAASVLALRRVRDAYYRIRLMNRRTAFLNFMLAQRVMVDHAEVSSSSYRVLPDAQVDDFVSAHEFEILSRLYPDYRSMERSRIPDFVFERVYDRELSFASEGYGTEEEGEGSVGGQGEGDVAGGAAILGEHHV